MCFFSCMEISYILALLVNALYGVRISFFMDV